MTNYHCVCLYISNPNTECLNVCVEYTHPVYLNLSMHAHTAVRISVTDPFESDLWLEKVL